MEPEKFREFMKKGAVVCVQLTPFKEDEDVDYEGLRDNTTWLVEESKGEPLVLVPVGSTGEKYALSDEEWKKVVRTVVDAANGKVPIMPGASHSGTRVAIERAKYAQDIGADGIMVVLPYYHVPEEEGLYLHYKRICDAIDIGVMPYNNPDVSKIYMKPHLLKRLVDNANNIVAVKENTPFIPTLYEHIKTVGDKVPIMQGRGEWWFAATAFLGVKGYISGYANFMPKICFDLLRAGLNGDFKGLKKIIEEKLDPYEEFIAKMCKKYGPSTTILPYPYVSSYMIYAVMKTTMDMLGLKGEHMRLPLLDLKEEDKKELEKIVFEKLGLNKVK
ncbi:MAG: dihydrodipicolinate synthase family protein [Candidatus Brockarchaeota archaeon]|nr:dihydrodipicolinate synthase family protein [Candidatus Brockarchaeota archaeon]